MRIPHNSVPSILREAIDRKKSVQFSYYDDAWEKTTRMVKPIRFEVKNKEMYLRAFCNLRKERSTFDVRKISDLKIIEDDKK